MTDAAHPEAGAVTGTPASDDPIARLSAILGDEDDQQNNSDPQGDDGADLGDGDPNNQSDGDGDPQGEPDPNDPDNGGEPQQAAIDPPVSWKAEFKERFAELPPEVQAYIAEREGQVDKAIRTAAEQGNAKTRQELAQRDQALTELQQHYATQLQQFLGSDAPQRPDPAWLDVTQYGEDGPRAFYQQQAIYEAHLAQRDAAHQELQQTQAQLAAQEAQARAAFDAEQNRILTEAIPEWGNPETRAAIAKDIATVAEALGYTPERLNDVDATDVLALNRVREWKAKADKLDDLNKAKMAAVRQAKDLPKVAKPNAAQPAGSAQARAINEHRSRLRQSGSVHDAAALLKNFL